MEFDLENPLASSDVESRWNTMAALLAAESDHMVSPAGAVDRAIHSDAVSLLLQAQSVCSLDPFVVYLAINYVHRFLSKRPASMEKPWILRLLVVSCLSLAAKMNKSADFSIADLQLAEGYVFDARTIRRMELLVLRALDWRMRSVTPFAFFRYFVSFFSPDRPPLLYALKSHASHTIFKTQCDIKIMEFKPSVVAAASLLSAAYELFPMQFPAFQSSIVSCEFLNREELLECYSLIDGWDASPEKSSSCDTPVTVLDTQNRHCPSSESDRASVRSDDRDLMKRRISTFHPCDWEHVTE